MVLLCHQSNSHTSIKLNLFFPPPPYSVYHFLLPVVMTYHSLPVIDTTTHRSTHCFTILSPLSWLEPPGKHVLHFHILCSHVEYACWIKRNWVGFHFFLFFSLYYCCTHYPTVRCLSWNIVISKYFFPFFTIFQLKGQHYF